VYSIPIGAGTYDYLPFSKAIKVFMRITGLRIFINTVIQGPFYYMEVPESESV